MASVQLPRSPQSEPAPLSTGKGTVELAEMVVFVDGRTDSAGILEFAGMLAQEHGAHLIAVFMQPGPAISPSETFARGEGIFNVIEAHRAQLERIEGAPPRPVRGHRPSLRNSVGVEIVALLEQ